MNVLKIFAYGILGFFIIDTITYHKHKKVLMILIAISIVFITGFRYYSLGVDMVRYSRHYFYTSGLNFRQCLSYRSNSQFYFLLTWISSKLGIDFQGFVFVVAIITFPTVCWYFYKNSVSPILSIIIFMGMSCFTFFLTGIRQSISMSIAIIAIDCYKKGNILKTTLLTIVAVLFHPTALVLIPYFLVLKVRFNSIVFAVYSIVLVIFFVFRVQLGQIINYLYLGSEDYKYVSNIKVGGIALTILFTLVVYIVLYKNDIMRENDKDKSALLHGIIIMTLIQLLASFSYNFTRLNLFYVIPIECVVLPNIICSKDMYVKFGKMYLLIEIVTISVLCFLMLSLFNAYITYDNLTEYYFYWQY